jgi:hypothetical protein
MSPTTATLTIVERLEQVGHEALTAVEHAAVWLVGKLATAETSLLALEADSPWLAEAWAEGVKSAEFHGVPVAAIENVGAAIMTAAVSFAAGLQQTAPVVAPVPAPVPVPIPVAAAPVPDPAPIIKPDPDPAPVAMAGTTAT